jgi:hypothetical protein
MLIDEKGSGPVIGQFSCGLRALIEAHDDLTVTRCRLRQNVGVGAERADIVLLDCDQINALICSTIAAEAPTPIILLTESDRDFGIKQSNPAWRQVQRPDA